MSDFYILDGHEPKRVESVTEWAKMFEPATNRIVKQDHIGEVLVSTVFLGLDHRFGPGPPLLFETMVFRGPHDEEQWRCSTWDEAVKQHEVAVALVKT